MEKILLFLSVFLNIALLYKSIILFFQTLPNRFIRLVKNILGRFGLYSDRAHTIQKNSIAYYACDMTIEYLDDNKNIPAIKLPDSLVIKPGQYIFADKHYDLTREGLYRFMFPAKKQNAQHIVYEKNISALMSSLAWIMTHGHRDDGHAFSELLLKAQQEKLILTCEASARFAAAILQSLNIPSRIVGSRTLDPWTGYDDGHYLLEVYRADLEKWVLYDLDHDVCFVKEGAPLSLIEWMNALVSGDYQLQFLSNDIKATLNDQNEFEYDFTFINEGRMNYLKQWYQHIMQFIFIENEKDNYSYFTLDNTLLNHYPKGGFPSINAMSKEAFIEKFYEEVT